MASIFDLFKKSKAYIGSAVAADITDDEMRSSTSSAGVVTGARPLVNPELGGGYSPSVINEILNAVEGGDEFAHLRFFKLADRIIEREAQTSSVLQGLVTAIAGLPHIARPLKGDSSPEAAKLAVEIGQMIKPSARLRLEAPRIISQGFSHSIGVAGVRWNKAVQPWQPVAFEPKPAHYFMYDRADGNTPLLRSATAGQPAEPIKPGSAIVFMPRRNSAMQIKNSLAWVLCWTYQIKSAAIADQMLFMQTFGSPLIVAKYASTVRDPKEISALKSAVAALNSTFRGVFREDVTIDFKEITSSGSDIYEQVCRYIDELIAKFIWANTLSSDAGKVGSQALGKVHAEAKYDVIRSGASQWAACLQEFFDLYTEWNYGPDHPKIEIVVDVEESEDEVAGSEVVKNLSAAGVELSQDEVRERFGFRKPKPGEATLGGAPVAPSLQPQAPGKASNSRFGRVLEGGLGVGCSEHSAHALGAVPRDAMDDLADAMLADWADATAGIDAALQGAAAGAGSIEEMRALLLESVNSLDVSALTALLTKARTATRVAGDSGADI